MTDKARSINTRTSNYEAVSTTKGQFISDVVNIEINVGKRLRKIRTLQGLSMRSLAEMSGLNINTLSLI